MPVSREDILTKVNQAALDALDAAIKSGKGNWLRGFQQGELSAPRNLQSGKRYRGVNALLLAWTDYSDPRWTTFKAAKQMGGNVRKGEKSTLVTFWKRIKAKDPDAPNGEKVIPLLRYYNVFNVEQIDWPEGVLKPLPTVEPKDNTVDDAEGIFRAYIDSDAELSVRWGGNQPSYAPRAHRINLPEAERFDGPEEFYGTAYHECVHSTHRDCKRELGTNFGSESYAREELVAEIGAVFVLTAAGLTPKTNNSAAYLRGWMRAIQQDDGLLMKAAGQAQRAADRILGVTFNNESE